jgi:hypothetical protein
MQFAYSASTLVLSIFAASPAVITSITWGKFDADNHFPASGALMIDWFDKGTPEYGYGGTCSGVLIHPKIFLTAAHCFTVNAFLNASGYPLPRPVHTSNPEHEARPDTIGTPGIWVSFNNTPADFNPMGEKCESCLYIERAIVNPYYTEGSSLKGDVAVVVLKEEYTDTPLMVLPPEGFLDDLQKQKVLSKASIINVGYGGSFNNATTKPHDVEYLFTRRISNSTVKSLNQEYLGLNMHENSDNGGTCYGGKYFILDCEAQVESAFSFTHL